MTGFAGLAATDSFLESRNGLDRVTVYVRMRHAPIPGNEVSED